MIYSINISFSWLCMAETIVTVLFFVKGGKARARVMSAAGGLTRGGSVWGARGLRETSQHNSQHETSQSEWYKSNEKLPKRRF